MKLQIERKMGLHRSRSSWHSRGWGQTRLPLPHVLRSRCRWCQCLRGQCVAGTRIFWAARAQHRPPWPPPTPVPVRWVARWLRRQRHQSEPSLLLPCGGPSRKPERTCMAPTQTQSHCIEALRMWDSFPPLKTRQPWAQTAIPPERAHHAHPPVVLYSRSATPRPRIFGASSIQ